MWKKQTKKKENVIWFRFGTITLKQNVGPFIDEAAGYPAP